MDCRICVFDYNASDCVHTTEAVRRVGGEGRSRHPEIIR